MDCVYLKPQISQQQIGTLSICGCDIHGQCSPVGVETAPRYACCETCKDKLLPSNPDFSSRFLDPLTVVDRERNPTHALRNVLKGKRTFLVCGGPSAKALPLNLLEQRGIWSIAVNNMAGFYRANAFICADPPLKFHDGIWLDPCVMKFVPIPKLTGRRVNLRHKGPDGFVPLMVEGKKTTTTDCPNVWGFGRRSWLQVDDTFFTDKDAAWGNHDSGCRRTGLEKTVMTMLLATRVLYYLGSRRIYLVGVDFFMNPQAGLRDNYAFGQKRDGDACDSNNNQFRVVNDWMKMMVDNGTFKRFGLEIFNCNPRSGLRAFEYVPFELAVKDALTDFPASPFDLEGWYEKK